MADSLFPKMKYLQYVTFLLLVLPVIAANAGTQKAADQDLTRRIDQLIRGLDDDDFKVREESLKQLIQLGKRALPAVRKATKSPSIEVRSRAKRVLIEIRRLSRNLRYVDSVTRDELKYAVSAAVSGDGKHLYAAGWRANTINVFTRDVKSGRLEHLQTISDQKHLRGAICLRLSPNGRYAVAPAFQSQTAVLFARDPQTGKLELLDVARNEEDGVKGLRWAMDAVFSKDSRFVYVIDPRGSGSRIETVDGQDGAVTVFRISENSQLEWIESNVGRNGCFNGARGIALHPNGSTIYVTSSGAGTLVVLSRQRDTGKVKVRQIIKDDETEAHGLAGVSSVACSPDGKFVYTSAGRFHGDNAVSVFKCGLDGTLSLVQELFNETEALRSFEGGNEILVSPDGQNVYAAATRSSSIACFQRDPQTGKLTHFDNMKDATTGDGSGLGPAGLGISPDGGFLYAAIESRNAIAIFRRVPLDAGDSTTAAQKKNKKKK